MLSSRPLTTNSQKCWVPNITPPARTPSRFACSRQTPRSAPPRAVRRAVTGGRRGCQASWRARAAASRDSTIAERPSATASAPSASTCSASARVHRAPAARMATSGGSAARKIGSACSDGRLAVGSSARQSDRCTKSAPSSREPARRLHALVEVEALGVAEVFGRQADADRERRVPPVARTARSASRSSRARFSSGPPQASVRRFCSALRNCVKR